MVKKSEYLPICFNIFLIFIFLFSIFPQVDEQAGLPSGYILDSTLKEYSNSVDESARTAIEEAINPLNQMSNVNSTLKWGEGDELVDEDTLATEEELAKLTDKELQELLGTGKNQLHRINGAQGSSSDPNSIPSISPRGKSFFTDTGFNLDQYLCNTQGPIQFDIDVDIEIDPNDPEVFAELTLRVYDVDVLGGEGTTGCGEDNFTPYCPPEVDQVFINNHFIGTLTGANNKWSIVTLDFNPNFVVKGNNTITINIDETAPHPGHPSRLECWATAADWGELILPYKDVGIERQDISFVEGTTPVDIRVEVHNYGTLKVENIDVHVFDIDPETNAEELFGTATIDKLAAEASEEITFPWYRPVKKKYTVKVIIDPRNTIVEADETNNQAQKKYTDLEVVTLDYRFHWVFLISDLFDPLENEYTATVDSEKPVERVEFTLVEANKQVIDSTESDGWKASFDMHEDLVDGWNTLEVIAYDEDGKASDPKEERIYGVAFPTWLTFLINSWNFHEEVRNVLGGDFTSGSPIKVETDIPGKKVMYKLAFAYSESVWIPIPKIPIIQAGASFDVWFNLDLESTGSVNASGGGKLGLGFQLSITELAKLDDVVNEFLSYIAEASIKLTTSFVIEIAGSASFGEGGLENLALSLKIGMEDEASGTLTALNTGIQVSLKSGIYAIFYIYDSDFAGNTQGWKDRIEFEIKTEITVRGSIALATLVGRAWELQITMDKFFKFFSLRGEVVVLLIETDYNFWDPDTTNTTIVYSNTFGTSTTSSSSFSSQKNVKNIYTKISTEREILDSSNVHSIPSIAAWSDNYAMILWSEFTPGATTPAGYDIYYSIWNGASWSNKSVVQDSSYPDFYPNVVFTSGGDTIAVWTRFDDISIVNSTNPNSVVNKSQLYWSLFDGSSWSVPQPLTSNVVSKGGTILSRDITGSNVILTWYEDDDGNHSTITDRSIQTMFYDDSTWSSIMTVASGTSVAGKISAAYDGTIGIIAWATDSDGDVFTAADQEIYTTVYTGGTWQAPIALTSNAVSDLSPTTVITKNGIPKLVWITYPLVSSGTNETLPTIMSTNYSIGSWQTPRIVFTPSGQSGNYTFLPLDLALKQDYQDDLILFMRGISNISHSFDIGCLNYVNSSDAWGVEILPLTLSNAGEIAFSSALSLQTNNDMIFVAFTRDFTIPVENDTNTLIATGLHVFARQKQLDIEIQYDDVLIEGLLGLGNTVTIHSKVRNTGDFITGVFQVKLYRSGTVYETYTVNSLLPGELFSFSYDWIIDSSYTRAIMIIDIDSNSQLTECNESNNQVIIYGYVLDPRVIPNSLKYNFEENSFQVDAYSDNNYSYKIRVNVLVQFYLGGLPGYGGTLIASATREVHDYHVVTLTVPNDGLPINDLNVVYVRLVLGPEYTDSNTTNNIDHSIIARIPEIQIVPQLIKLGSNYKSSDNITTQFMLRNVGSGDALDFSVNVYQLNGLSKTLVANVIVERIQSGEYLFLSAHWTGAPGLYHLQFVIDPIGVLLDSDRSNNVVNITKCIATVPSIELDAVDSLQAITLHGGSKFDAFMVNLSLNVNVAGDYRIKSWLKEPSERYIPIDFISSLSAGFNNVYMNFSAYQFGRTGFNGTLVISELVILNASTGRKIIHDFDLFNSAIFNSTDFKQAPILTQFVNEANINLLNLDSSDRYRNIDITVEITTFTPGRYQVVGVVRLPDGSTVSTSSHYQQFDTTTTSFTLSFISDDFFEIENINDPFILKEIYILNQSIIIGYVHYGAILFNTSKIFSPGPLTLTGRIFDIPSDSNDQDTLYDELAILIEVDVHWSINSYVINAKLSTNDGIAIGWGQETLSLNPGLRNITLVFNGIDIWGTLQDGPLVVSDILIHPSNEVTRIIRTRRRYNTSAYQYTNFQNSAAIIRGQVNRTSGRVRGIVLWYSYPQNVFTQTNATGHYHLVVRPLPGTYEVSISLVSQQFFILLNDELITRGTSYALLVEEEGQIIDLDFIEPYTVDPSGNYPTIQAAINHASTGDYVLVPSDLCGVEGGIVVNKSVRIEGYLGSEGSYPIINAANQSFGFHVTASHVHLNGFKIGNSSGPGIWIDGVTNVRVTKITAVNNTVGIRATSVTDSTFFGNNLINNSLNAYDDGSNQWDSGLIGNFYSNYAGIDTNGDHIGETPHPIAGGILVDRYPRTLHQDKDTVFVDPQGGGDFQSISRALEWINDDANIRIYPGVYCEKIVITKPLKLIAPQGSNSVSIMYFSQSNLFEYTIDIRSPAYLDHLTVTGKIHVDSDDVTIDHLRLYGVLETTYGTERFTLKNALIQATAAEVDFHSSSTIDIDYSDNIIISNVTINTYKGGIFFHHSHNSIIDHVKIVHDSTINTVSPAWSYGLHIGHSNNAIITNNYIVLDKNDTWAWEIDNRILGEGIILTYSPNGLIRN
ncbi:MAG: CARDB domain-containing protein, partial [Candidatus Hodarchaeales archaeon]